jgi:hypothetical protein
MEPVSRQPPDVLPYQVPTPQPDLAQIIAANLRRCAVGLICIAWIMTLSGTLYVAALIAYAHYRSPTWPYERFARNVGNEYRLLGFAQWVHLVGLVAASLALVSKGWKWWIAIVAIAANLIAILQLARPLRYWWRELLGT